MYERSNLKPKPATPLALFLDQCLLYNHHVCIAYMYIFINRPRICCRIHHYMKILKLPHKNIILLHVKMRYKFIKQTY